MWTAESSKLSLSLDEYSSLWCWCPFGSRRGSLSLQWTLDAQYAKNTILRFAFVWPYPVIPAYIVLWGRRTTMSSSLGGLRLRFCFRLDHVFRIFLCLTEKQPSIAHVVKQLCEYLKTIPSWHEKWRGTASVLAISRDLLENLTLPQRCLRLLHLFYNISLRTLCVVWLT